MKYESSPVMQGASLSHSKSGATLQQTLHGYDGGHRLLESSIDLPPTTRRLMLLLSDLSGPEMDDGFDGYVTGYPLSEIKAYALARTWYANEMPRPGCVWTHTILIPFTELEKNWRIFDWVQLLRRPERSNRDGYRSALATPLTRSQPTLRNFSKVQARMLLNSVYTYPDQAIVFTATEASSLEAIILLLWNYQWPRLRRNFTFCTGALSPRLFGEHPFDLQVAPFQIARTFGREPARYRVYNADAVISPRIEQNDSNWLKIATDDLNPKNLVPAFSERFCWHYSIDVRAHRSAFIPLLETFVDIEQGRLLVNQQYSGQRTLADQMTMYLTQLVENVAERFTVAREARRLKMDLFGGSKDLGLWYPYSWPESIILQVLGTTIGVP